MKSIERCAQREMGEMFHHGVQGEVIIRYGSVTCSR